MKLVRFFEIIKNYSTEKEFLSTGRKMLCDPHYQEVLEVSRRESQKTPTRTDILNFLLSLTEGESKYLEIGVRDPNDNYKHVMADEKYSVDPGVEYSENPVDFQITSDEFFELLANGEVLSPGIKFDVIFIDGLHLAEQVERDIRHALECIKDDGFVVLHDCNPPTEWHARENYYYRHTPAKGLWNGTTWKAFLKYRFDPSVNSCCVDTDWGVGILSKYQPLGESIEVCNPFFEFDDFSKNREAYLNLIEFPELRRFLLA